MKKLRTKKSHFGYEFQKEHKLYEKVKIKKGRRLFQHKSPDVKILETNDRPVITTVITLCAYRARVSSLFERPALTLSSDDTGVRLMQPARARFGYKAKAKNKNSAMVKNVHRTISDLYSENISNSGRHLRHRRQYPVLIQFAEGRRRRGAERVMKFSLAPDGPTREEFEQVKEFVYFGSLFTNNGKYDRDLERKVNGGNKMNGSLLAIVNTKSVSRQMSLAIRNEVLVPTLMYAPVPNEQIYQFLRDSKTAQNQLVSKKGRPRTERTPQSHSPAHLVEEVRLTDMSTLSAALNYSSPMALRDVGTGFDGNLPAEYNNIQN
ncbi:hypothetical protein EVAR_16718_1 [Eumeta japonica]|uniref:Uncharacterized protein n=1 Tax=Eumeta variegata TaxID=151549 RepID=A0A4C1V5A0_EUMVA|nr:hypothetical protein EVAR_16718_1 [Eumeta japonica]